MAIFSEEDKTVENCPFSGCMMRKGNWEEMKGHIRGSHLRAEVNLSQRGKADVLCPHCPESRPNVNRNSQAY